MVRRQLKVDGMHCASCAMLIDEELEEIPGVSRASTSWPRQKLDVEYDESRVDDARIVATIAELGYDARPDD